MLNIKSHQINIFHFFLLHLFTLISVFILSFGSLAKAHATIVLGTLSTEPAVLTTAEPFMLKIDMVDPSQVPVEDAWVMAEFRSEGAAKNSEPITIRFEESSEQAGLYLAELSLEQEGAWQLLLRDQTYRQEEATANLTFTLAEGEAFEDMQFIFPPTATGSNLLRRWLIWIIALPILTGVIVTVLVLRQARPEDEDASARDPITQ